MTNTTPSPSGEQPERDLRRAQVERDVLRTRLAEVQQRYTRYQRELDERRQFLAYATPEDDALELAKAAALIPVYEQTIARLGPEINDLQQEVILVERMIHNREDHFDH